MLMKPFVFLIILVAIGAGLTTVLWHEQIIQVAMFRDFFDVALPVLGFGALIKYLCTCANCCSHKDD